MSTCTPVSGDMVKALVRDHEAVLYRRALRLCGQSSDAWDLVQDTFERALKMLPLDYPPEKARGWLFVTVKNLFIDRRRALRRRSHLPLSDHLASADPRADEERGAWRLVDDRLIDECLERLDPRLREVYLLRVTGGMSLAHIGERLGIPLATAGTRMHRARARLRTMLEPRPAS